MTNLAASLRWLAAVAATLLFLAGVPLLALALPSPLDPNRGLASIVTAIANDTQIFDEALMSVIAAAIWILWSYLVLAALAEALVAIRGGVQTVRGLALGQSFARPIISALMWSSTATGIAASTIGAGGVALLAAPTASAQMTYDNDSSASAPGRPGAAMDANHIVRMDHGALLVLGEQSRPHLIASTPDSFWNLAERHLGDPFRWREIAHLNPDVDDPDLIPTGQIVNLPVDAINTTAPPAAGVQTDPDRVDAEMMIVESGDTLWSLTEEQLRTTLGEPPSVADVAAALAAIDAAGLQSGDHDLIYPGERIPSPAPAEPELKVWTLAVADDEPTPPVAAEGLRVVEAGDSMWTIARAELAANMAAPPSPDEVAAYWADLVDANRDVASGDVDILAHGDEVHLPPVAPAQATTQATSEEPLVALVGSVDGVVDGPAIGSTSRAQPVEVHKPAAVESQVATTESKLAEPALPPPSGTVATGSGDSLTRPADREAPASVDEATSREAVAMMTFGTAMLATGLVGALRRRRNLQRRVRHAGEMPRQPAAGAALFGTAMAHAAHDVYESRLGAGWRLMPMSTVAPLQAAGPVEYHAEETGQLHVVSIDPTPAAPEQTTVSFDFGADADDDPAAGAPRADSGIAVAPTSLLIGTDNLSGAAVLVDLGSVGQLDVVGSDNDVHRFMQTAVLDLATSARADDVLVIAIGVAHELSDLDRVRAVNSFAEAWTVAMHSGHAGADSPTPIVVVSNRGPERDEGEEEALAALRQLGVLIVVPGLGGISSVVIEGEHATVHPSGTEVALVALHRNEFRAAIELVATSAVAASGPVELSSPLTGSLDAVEECASQGLPGEVEVRVLGPVDVAGAGLFSSLKAVDVVTYLAFHRNGVDGDQIKTWVWPAFEPPTDKAFANVMSRARTALGVDGDGTPRLSRAGADKTYRLARSVTTDFDRFRALVAKADAAADRTEGLDRLQQALTLLRGVPFTGGAASSFAWADNHVRAHIEFTIDETVHRCADLAIELDDLNTARWAVLKGLELVPGCEQCFRRRFLIAGAGNNRSELRRAMADLERSVAADLGEPEAVDSISAELLELYHELDRALVSGTM